MSSICCLIFESPRIIPSRVDEKVVDCNIAHHLKGTVEVGFSSNIFLRTNFAILISKTASSSGSKLCASSKASPTSSLNGNTVPDLML